MSQISIIFTSIEVGSPRNRDGSLAKERSDRPLIPNGLLSINCLLIITEFYTRYIW